MDTTLTPRQITHDEKKAAEAAFAGRPFNPKWSDAARIVYDGLLAAMGKDARTVDMHDELEPVEPLAYPPRVVSSGTGGVQRDLPGLSAPCGTTDVA